MATQTRFFRLLPVTLAAALAGACGGGSGGSIAPGTPAVQDDCSAAGQKQFVLDVMRDIYFWNAELPDVDPADFASAEQLLDRLLFTPLDRFTFINDAAADDAFFSDSQFIGVGLGLKVDESDAIRVTQAFADGPAAAVGIGRGFTVLAINGQSAAEIVNGDGISAAFGADEEGVQVDLEYADLAGTVAQATLFKGLVTIETVTTSSVLNVGGRRIGYLALRNFVRPTTEALEAAFAGFSAAGIDDLIVDLRYNGGGLVSVAEQLGNLIGGLTTSGGIFAERTHNQNNSFRNVTTLFQDSGNSVDSSRLVVIGSGATASASELVANALEPFMEVTWVGADTFGKPVGSYGFEFCGKVVHPIAFQNFNADGAGEYFDGFKADCVAQDDLLHELGDPQEASLNEAINFLATGACSAARAAVGKPQPKEDARQKLRRLGLAGHRLLTGAW